MRFGTQSATLLLLATLSSIASAGGTWTVWFNRKNHCGGDSYKVIGSASQDCTTVDVVWGAASVMRYTQIASGYCKLYMYSDYGCTGTSWTDTGYATDAGGTGYGEYCNDITDTTGDVVQSWKMYCTP